MESLEETSKSISSKMGFFKHVFNFDDNSKSEILNIIQYALLAVIPIVLLNKVMQKYVPEAEEEKGSFELLAEIAIQVIVMFMGILMINRIITYIPTYSGAKYPEFSVTYIILAVLMITMSLQTKLGEKVSILFDRVAELWGGDDSSKKKKKGKGQGNVRVSQPISTQNPDQSAMNQSFMGTTSISQLPPQQESGANYNAMYRQDTTPLVNAATPGGEGFHNMGPVAANEAFGGFGGTPF
jgi:hypothetical protein